MIWWADKITLSILGSILAFLGGIVVILIFYRDTVIFRIIEGLIEISFIIAASIMIAMFAYLFFSDLRQRR